MNILNLHVPGNFIPHTFDAMPSSLFVAVRVQTVAPVEEQRFPIPEVDITTVRFVNIASLSEELRDAILKEIFMAHAPPEFHPKISEEEIPNPSPAVAPSVWVGDNVTATRIEPKVVKHEGLDSFIGALADCREAGGDLLPCDDPRSLTIGFVHHPLQDGESVVHEIRIRWTKTTTVSDEVAARVGLTPEEIRESLKTYEGRETLVTGTAPVPDTTPEQDAELEAMLMVDPVRVSIKDGVVEFPEVDLFQSADLIESVPDLEFHPIRPRPAWMPDGWTILELNTDWYRAGVLDEPAPANATGTYARRGDHLFRAFDDGRWDESTWQPPLDTEGEYQPAGYRIHRSGHAETANIEAALREVLPSYHATPPAVVRGG